MEKIQLNASSPYEIWVGQGLLEQVGTRLAALPHGPETVALVTDCTVEALYGEKVRRWISGAGLRVESFVFPAGEQSKSLQVYGQLLEFLAQKQLTRRDVVVALGGGVTGDLAGFAAATYLRGVPLVQIPTTLLAAVDSSVGGKTAIDLPSGKNLAGAFYQPELVLCDPETLQTLPREILLDGVAETVKYGVLSDPALFERLRKGLPQAEEWVEVITRCVKSKKYFVEQDERDTGARRMLNLGHTIGHAIEQCSGLTISHGHAVAIGMVLMARGAYRQGLVERDLSPVLEETLKMLGLPVDCNFTPEALYQAACHDKKRSGGEIALVVPEEIGRCRIAVQPMEMLLPLLEQAVAL